MFAAMVKVSSRSSSSSSSRGMERMMPALFAAGDNDNNDGANTNDNGAPAPSDAGGFQIEKMISQQTQDAFWNVFNQVSNVAIGLLIIIRIAEFVNNGASGAAPTVP